MAASPVLSHQLPDRVPHGISVFERGWLSSNNILLHAAPGEAGATLVDTSHLNHAAQTVALIQHALAGRPLARVLNTHLHSDHCGGNATVSRRFGVPVAIPPGQADAVRQWDEDQLSYRASGQRCEAFAIDGTLDPGELLVAGGREWQVIHAPGHDPHSVILFQRDSGTLISADALWQDGFGVVFPEVEGEPGFDDVAAVLELIAALPVRLVIPGHGAPFTDVHDALGRARQRLQRFRADPARHARYASKVFIKYHLMEEREMTRSAVRAWALQTPLMQAVWQRWPPQGSLSAEAWVDGLVNDLIGGGALALEGEWVRDV